MRAKNYDITGKSLIHVSPIPFNEVPSSDWIFFSSKNAVEHFFSQHPKLSPTIQFGVIGKATGLALQKHTKVSFVGIGEPKQVAATFKKLAQHKTILFPGSDKSIRTIQLQFTEDEIIDFPVYKTEIIDFILPQSDVLIFTSPSNVQGYLQSNTISEEQKVIAIGKTTARELAKLGIEALIPWQSSELAISDNIY